MKMKLGILAISIGIFVLSSFFIACDSDIGSTHNGLGQGQVYVLSGTNNDVRSVMSSRNICGNEVEFLFVVLMLKDDANEGGTWVIAPGANDGAVDNAGWYDIDGVNRTEFSGTLKQSPHSCFLLRLKGIRINDTFFKPTEDGKSMCIFDGDKEDYSIDLSWPMLNLIAGDLNKFGPGESYDEGDTNIPFEGIPRGKEYLEEFVIFVDEDKLYDEVDGEIILKDNWWKCFSFTATAL